MTFAGWVATLAGWITKDLTREPLGEDRNGVPVYLKDIWPTEQELQEKQKQYTQNEAIINQLRQQVQTALAKVARAKAARGSTGRDRRGRDRPVDGRGPARGGH